MCRVFAPSRCGAIVTLTATFEEFLGLDMAQLEKVDLGAPGSGVGGDSPRSANERMNRNVDILNSQMALRAAQTSITSSQTLTVTDHVGRRVGINFGSPGWVKLPAAKKCAADQVIHLRNVGLTSVTLAVEDGSGDYIGLDVLQPFESVLMDTNGSTGWWVLFAVALRQPTKLFMVD